MWCNPQCNWDESVIPHVGKRPVPEIMTQTSKLNTLDISVCDAKFWLLVLEVASHTTSQMCNAWRKC